MKNDYKVVGNTVLMYLGNGGVATIDAKDLNIAQEYHGTWRRFESGTNEYVLGNVKGKNIYLHREIMNCPDGFVVDHIDGDGLDNRRRNLRIVTQAENLQNLPNGAKSNSQSGIRNVFYDRYFDKWVVEVAVNGQVVYKKRFKFKKDAEIASVMARAKYQPFSPEGTAIRNNSHLFPEMKGFVEYEI